LIGEKGIKLRKRAEEEENIVEEVKRVRGTDRKRHKELKERENEKEREWDTEIERKRDKGIKKGQE